MDYEKAETCRCWDKLCKNALAVQTLQVVFHCKCTYSYIRDPLQHNGELTWKFCDGIAWRLVNSKDLKNDYLPVDMV
jgi:hypothetical protein